MNCAGCHAAIEHADPARINGIGTVRGGQRFFTHCNNCRHTGGPCVKAFGTAPNNETWRKAA